MFVRSPYNYDMMEASDESGLKCEDESLALQSGKDEADINVIVRRFGITGQLPTGVRAPVFGDFTGVEDYHSAMNAIIAAEESFEQMPAEVRARFQNDPQQFLEFCSDEANREEASKLGLVVPKAQELAASAVDIVATTVAPSTVVT